MKLSVIIPCYNAAATLAEQLDALAIQRWDQPWEIVVANNRSTDNSMEIVKRYQAHIPNLRIVDASERQGQPFALNTGTIAALGESVCFADADDVIGGTYVSAMGEALEQHEFVACRIDSERLNSPWVASSRGSFQSTGLQQYTDPPYLQHAGGGTLGIRRKLFLAIGMFDESLPYLHDTDLCWRVQLAGFGLHFVPEAVMHVRYRDSWKAMYRQTQNYAIYNVIMYKRYRRLGMPAIPWHESVKGWIDLLMLMPWIRNRNDLAFWVRLYAWRVGRLRASIQYRVFAI
ncbi:MAG: glycosyltransferase [Roseiflexaceae bacterium]|nr:glycosyltransferase [Roseiflexaceae bacterium]